MAFQFFLPISWHRPPNYQLQASNSFNATAQEMRKRVLASKDPHLGLSAGKNISARGFYVQEDMHIYDIYIYVHIYIYIYIIFAEPKKPFVTIVICRPNDPCFGGFEENPGVI